MTTGAATAAFMFMVVVVVVANKIMPARAETTILDDYEQ
jgi:hypothetical protein